MMICKENEMMALQPIPETMEKKTVILKGTFMRRTGNFHL